MWNPVGGSELFCCMIGPLNPFYITYAHKHSFLTLEEMIEYRITDKELFFSSIENPSDRHRNLHKLQWEL